MMSNEQETVFVLVLEGGEHSVVPVMFLDLLNENIREMEYEYEKCEPESKLQPTALKNYFEMIVATGVNAYTVAKLGLLEEPHDEKILLRSNEQNESEVSEEKGEFQILRKLHFHPVMAKSFRQRPIYPSKFWKISSRIVFRYFQPFFFAISLNHEVEIVKDWLLQTVLCVLATYVWNSHGGRFDSLKPWEFVKSSQTSPGLNGFYQSVLESIVHDVSFKLLFGTENVPAVHGLKIPRNPEVDDVSYCGFESNDVYTLVCAVEWLHGLFFRRREKFPSETGKRKDETKKKIFEIGFHCVKSLGEWFLTRFGQKLLDKCRRKVLKRFGENSSLFYVATFLTSPIFSNGIIRGCFAYFETTFYRNMFNHERDEELGRIAKQLLSNKKEVVGHDIGTVVLPKTDEPWGFVILKDPNKSIKSDVCVNLLKTFSNSFWPLETPSPWLSFKSFKRTKYEDPTCATFKIARKRFVDKKIVIISLGSSEVSSSMSGVPLPSQEQFELIRIGPVSVDSQLSPLEIIEFLENSKSIHEDIINSLARRIVQNRMKGKGSPKIV